MGAAKPILWHIPVSHYSEKARWALAYKDVAHDRRAPLPGPHMLVAMRLTRGASKTLPVLRIDGETIGDSTAIIAALEERIPEPPLYPADPDERRRALELEEFFDERVGPQVRLVAWHDLRRDRERMGELTTRMVPAPARRIGAVRAASRRFGATFVALRYGAGDDAAAERGREQVIAGFDRLEAELDGRDYLVGDRFTVADLTAAALLYPLVRPPEGPQILGSNPEALERFVEPLRERRGFEWVRAIYRRHRAGQPTSTIASTSTGTSNGS